MAKRTPRKAPAWLAENGQSSGKPQARQQPKRTDKAVRVTNIKGAIEGNDAQPVTVEPFTDAELDARLKTIVTESNPIGAAAMPLLRAICDLSEFNLRRRHVDHLHALLVQELRTFESLCHRANIARDHVVAASYCLCSALDEAAHHTKWGGGGKDGPEAWSQRALTSQFHGDRDGGTKVYQVLARMMQAPETNHPLIELIYWLMSIGFMGRYRVEAGGDLKHQQIRRQLYAILESQSPKVPDELSSSALSNVSSVRNFRPMYGFPIWGTVAICILVLLGQFSWYRYRLHEKQQEVLRIIESIGHIASQPPAWMSNPELQAEGHKAAGETR